MIEIKNLSFSFFNSHAKALDEVSLHIGPGSFIAITGPSGCGKSTLALAIGGYIPHVLEGRIEGEVLINGKRTVDMDLSEIASNTGIVQQDPESQLCTLSVYDEVSFGPENLGLPVDEVRKRVESSLSLAGASYLVERDLHGLSGGEKQRVAIASMLAMRPGILILDEPTSGLDPDGASSVLASIERLKKELSMTIIVIEHKLDKVTALADRLIVMNKGRVALDGTPSEVLSKYREKMKEIGVRLPGRRHYEKKEARAGNAMVNISGLSFSYGDRVALNDVSLAAHRHEITGIIGPNGSGKTTLLSHILGINKPQKGTVEVMGIDSGRSKTSALARKAGYVFQNPNHQIFEKTVYEEAAFARKNFRMDESETKEKVESALERYGLYKYRDKHPHGLSHGEKRRLNLCSVLPHGPDIIILDEPFVGQDYFSVTKMMADLHALRDEGKSIVLVSHDIDMVYRHCDRVVCMKSGKIIVDAPPEEAESLLRAKGMKGYAPEGDTV